MSSESLLLVFGKECFLDDVFLQRHERALKNIINFGYQKTRYKYEIIDGDRIGDQENFLEEMLISDEMQQFYFFLLIGSKSIIESPKQYNYCRSFRISYESGDTDSFDIPAQYVDSLHRSIDSQLETKLAGPDYIISEDEIDRVVGTLAVFTPDTGNDANGETFVIALTAVTSFLQGAGKKTFDRALKYILENESSPLSKEKLRAAGYKSVRVDVSYIDEHKLLNFYKRCGFRLNETKFVKVDLSGNILDNEFPNRLTATRDFHVVYVYMIIDL